MFLYSYEKSCFYNSDIHGNNTPSDVVEVKEEEYQNLLSGLSSGYVIVAGGDGYPVLADPPPVTIEDLATQQRAAIDTARDATFAAGMPYTLPDGSDDVVQTRPEDKTNLLGLAVEARDQKAAGETDAVMEFRGESNVTHNMTPQQMIDLTSAALGYIKQVYAQSWDRKDQIDAALEDEALSDADKRAAIEAVDW